MKTPRWKTTLAAGLLFGLATGLGLAAFGILQKPPLKPWHRHAPEELTGRALREADWSTYLSAEARLFTALHQGPSVAAPPEDQAPWNRYWPESPMHPSRLPHDWNRSYTQQPEGPAAGAVVLLHGMTDGPYSLRHIGARYRSNGWAVVSIRLPGHGTVPAGLRHINYQDWIAASALALREGRRLAGPDRPLHLVGYSSGGALALIITLNALNDPGAVIADRLVLLTPMIDVDPAAKLAWIMSIPARLPGLAKAGWLHIRPEYNPFKYNSFPYNGVRQSALVTANLRQALDRAEQSGSLARMPPVLAFQSVLDATIEAAPLYDLLFARLPDNGSELVYIDLNHAITWGPLAPSESMAEAARLADAQPVRNPVTVLSNTNHPDGLVEARTRHPGGRESRVAVGHFPAGVYSLSHISLPFPVTDGLYGIAPDPEDDQGVNLGAWPLRGESGFPLLEPALMARLSCNPFFDYMADLISEIIPP